VGLTTQHLENVTKNRFTYEDAGLRGNANFSEVSIAFLWLRKANVEERLSVQAEFVA
jgi:hypothetical protein